MFKSQGNHLLRKPTELKNIHTHMSTLTHQLLQDMIYVARNLKV